MSQINNWQIIATSLLILAFVLAVVNYARHKVSARVKIILISLRTICMIAVIIALVEPVIKFERFESGHLKIPVFVDVSASMQNFNPDEFVLPFVDTLFALQNKNENRIAFDFFLFGDSTRNHNITSPINFDDTKTFFPDDRQIDNRQNSREMIFITDGHFTNAKIASEIFPQSVMYYLTLPNATPRPFVTISADAPSSARADSAFFVNVSATGYASESGVLTVSLNEEGRTVRTENINVEQGHFSHEINIRVNNSRPGRRLYSAQARIESDAAHAETHFEHMTTPHFINYAIYSKTPSLDRRYLTNAISSDNFFRHRNNSPDILFLFDYDTTAARMIRALPRHALVVFAGALPCSTNVSAGSTITVRSADAGDFFANAAALRNLPPPQNFLTCEGRMPVSGSRRILQGDNNLTILSAGRFLNRQSLFLHVRGFWRWDFWPMSSDRIENELFGFSNTVINYAREKLLDNLSDRLIIYPAHDLTETVAANFLMSLPAALPVFEPFELSVQIIGDDVDIDTTINYTPHGHSRQPITFDALPANRYALSATLKSGGTTATFADSFTVNKDVSELSVMSQNVRYLNEFAIPLDIENLDDITALFDSWEERSLTRSTVVDEIRLYRSWWLLVIVLVIFGVELFLRKRFGLER